MTIAPRLHRIVATQPYPLLFASLRGGDVLQPEWVVGMEVREGAVRGAD